MAATVSPISSRLVGVNPDGTFTPEFLRAFNALYSSISGGGISGGVDPAIGGVNLPNFSMLSGTVPATRRWEYPNTNPNTWNERAGQMTLNADFYSNNYFALNPGAHIPIGLRCDIATVGSTPRFAGMILNSVVGAQEGAPFAPTTQIETRATGLDPGGTLRFLFPNSVGPASKPLQDATQYSLCLRSTLTENNQRFVRYQLWRFNTVHTAWDLEMDTGDMLDPNIWMDYTQSGLVFASVFEVNTTPGAWSIDWTNVNVTWAGVKDSVTDASARVARYDAQVEGDMTFIGNGRKFYLYSDSSGVAFNNWTHILSSTTNSNTNVVVTPNGTATAANILFTNKADLSGSFSYCTFGQNGAGAELTTGGISGGAVPNFAIKIGSTTTAVFKTTGIRLNGGSVDVGVASTLLTGATNVGGTNAVAFASSAQNFETYCTPGNIAAIAGAPVETVLRPLWCEFSVALADLRSRMLS